MLIWTPLVLRSLCSCQSYPPQGIRIPADPRTVALHGILQLVGRVCRIYNSGRDRHGPGGSYHCQLLRWPGASSPKCQVAAVRSEDLFASQLGSYHKLRLIRRNVTDSKSRATGCTMTQFAHLLAASACSVQNPMRFSGSFVRKGYE